MQKLFIVLFLITAFNSTAQNYQPFSPHLGSNYSITGNGPTGIPYGLYGVRFDSSSTSGTDSVFYTYHTYEDTSLTGVSPFNCVFTNRGKSWIGSEMIVRNNGDYVFNNQLNDSINIQSLADSGSEWVFYKFAADTFLTATVTSISNMFYNHFTDSVKVITLNKRDTSGHILPSIWNGKTIWLSKKHGLLKTPAFYAVPNDSTTYFHYYFPAHYSKAWYANHEVGDEIDITTEGSAFYSSVANRYLAKQYNTDSSFVTYTILNFNVHNNNMGNLVDTSYTTTQTLAVVTDTTPLLSDNVAWPTYYPLQPQSYFDTCLLTVSTTLGALLDSCSNGYFSYWFEFCGNETISYYGILDLYNYECRPQMGGYSSQTIDFYKKDGMECGTSEIIGIKEIQNNTDIKIYPNPSSDFIHVLCDGSNNVSSKLTLTSLYGEKIYTINIPSTGATLDIHNLADGLYILQLDFGDKKEFKKIVKVSAN